MLLLPRQQSRDYLKQVSEPGWKRKYRGEPESEGKKDTGQDHQTPASYKREAPAPQSSFWQNFSQEPRTKQNLAGARSEYKGGCERICLSHDGTEQGWEAKQRPGIQPMRYTPSPGQQSRSFPWGSLQ